MAKQATNFNLEKEQKNALVETSYQTGVPMSEIIRRLFRFLPEIRKELVEEARKRLEDA